jgi:hypothetical protein
MRREPLAAIEARAHGWPLPEAHQYLNELLRFEWNAGQQAGLERFWKSAFEAGLLERHRPLALLESACLPAHDCA